MRLRALTLVPFAVTLTLTAPPSKHSEPLLALAAPPSQHFEAVQPELFALSGGQPNCWADYDGDGDLDLFVGFKADLPNRLYRNDGGRFADVAEAAGVADTADTRAAAWGDFDGDGDLDLYVGFSRRANQANRLYRNDARAGRPDAGRESRFTEVGHALGLDLSGVETRQPAWVDYDNDGDLDLFVALRDGPNRLYRNDGGRFTDVAKDLGIDDPRKTVGAVWFDFDQDGRLDVFVANQDGDRNGLWHNEGARFVDVAERLGMDGNLPSRIGSNGPSVADFDNDGLLDLFVAGYGRNFLYRNLGDGTFADVAEAQGVAGGERATPSAWGDLDNDGRVDLYVSSYIDKPVNERDYLYRNEGGRFADATPELLRKHGATHGVQWVDFDRDGALDLALANNNPSGANSLLRNVLPPGDAVRSIEVSVVDRRGLATRAGSEVRVYAAGTRRVVGARLVDAGGGYVSQSVAPVHIGLGSVTRVDVEVTSFTPSGRRVTRVANVDPRRVEGRVLTVRVP